MERKKNLLEAEYKTILNKIHTVEIESAGNLQKAIDDSEFDYEVEGKIL